MLSQVFSTFFCKEDIAVDEKYKHHCMKRKHFFGKVDIEFEKYFRVHNLFWSSVDSKKNIGNVRPLGIRCNHKN